MAGIVKRMIPPKLLVYRRTRSVANLKDHPRDVEAKEVLWRPFSEWVQGEAEPSRTGAKGKAGGTISFSGVVFAHPLQLG